MLKFVLGNEICHCVPAHWFNNQSFFLIPIEYLRANKRTEELIVTALASNYSNIRYIYSIRYIKRLNICFKHPLLWSAPRKINFYTLGFFRDL